MSKADLDKLTIDDVNDFKGWKTNCNYNKKQFLVGFKQFLRWCGKRYKNREYIDLEEDIKIRIKPKQKTPDELLIKDFHFVLLVLGFRSMFTKIDG
jgi:hypothetical protein